MFSETVHCVVTACENVVRWRRVLHVTLPDTSDSPRADDPDTTEGLIADVSIYLCDEHHNAQGLLDDVEPFPPSRTDDE
jgi:hypothetical protein